MRCALLMFLLLSEAYSQPPAPTPSIPAQTKQNKSSEENQIGQPQDAPSTLTTVESKTPTRTNDKQANNASNSPTPNYRFLGASITDWLLAILTLCLVIVGGIQIFIYRKQAEYMRATNAVAHRPRLAIKFVTFAEPPLTADCLKGNFLVFNTGESNTTLRSTYSEVVIAPKLPSFYGVEESQILADTLAPGERTILSFPTGPAKEISVEDYMRLGNTRDVTRRGLAYPDGINLYLIGWVDYSDDTGKVRRFGFCRKYDWASERFGREAHPDYEYGD